MTDMNESQEALKAFESTSCKYTIVAVGEITEAPEGQLPYSIQEFGTEAAALNSTATYSRDESLRVLAETLGLKSGEGKAMVFSEVSDVNATEFKLVKGLREGGYTRPQEIDHMIVKGPKVSDFGICSLTFPLQIMELRACATERLLRLRLYHTNSCYGWIICYLSKPL